MIFTIEDDYGYVKIAFTNENAKNRAIDVLGITASDLEKGIWSVANKSIYYHPSDNVNKFISSLKIEVIEKKLTGK